MLFLTHKLLVCLIKVFYNILWRIDYFNERKILVA